MRVLHVLPHLGGGGPERRRLLLAKHLGAEFVQHVVCLKALPHFVEDFENAGVGVDVLDGKGGPLDFETAERLAEIARSFDADVIHGAVFEGVNLASLASIIRPEMKVIVEETGDPSKRSWRGDLVMRVWAHLADRCVSVSPPVTRYFLDKLRVPRERVIEIPNGVRMPKKFGLDERDAQREALGISRNQFVVGAIGRMKEEDKRYGDILQAIVELKRQGIPVRGLFVGDGEDFNDITEKIGDMSLQLEVLQVGYQEDVSPYLAAMDAFVLASPYESFGLVLAEAMLAGVPVIATKVGGVPFVVGDCGILVSPYSPQELALQLEFLWRNPEKRGTLAHLGRERAEALFSTKRYVEDVKQLYLNLGLT